jgi:hypothetical protein
MTVNKTWRKRLSRQKINNLEDVHCVRDALSAWRAEIILLSADGFELLQIMARNDEVGGFHVFAPGFFPASIFAFGDDRFATGILFKTAFAFGSPPITPSRFFTAR